MHFFDDADFDVGLAESHIKIIEHSFADEREILFQFFLREFDKRDDDFAQHRILIFGITGCR